MNISLIIPTYNRKDELQRALKSVLSGTIQPDEIIVIDDGSTDNTKELIKDFDVEYIYQPNRGVSSARNKGIKRAKYEWIAFLDSDDEWHGCKLEKQKEYHQQNPDTLCSQTNEIWMVDGKFKNQPKRYQKQSGNLYETLMRVCCVTTSSFMAHRAIFDRVGLFDEDLLACEDQDLYLRIAKEYKFGLLKDNLITKNAGCDNQLSFTTKFIDIYRIKLLLKHTDSKEAMQEAKRRYEIVKNGAIKRGNYELLELLKNVFRAF